MDKFKTILIFGGSGCLGNFIINKIIQNDLIESIFNFSRDDHKHWRMDQSFNNKKLKHIVGDVADKEAVRNTIIHINPDLIVIMSALKHVDRCELNTNACLRTNLYGTKNILDVVEEKHNELHNLKTVLFISTDKACSPINIYGMCKSMSENLMIDMSRKLENIKFITLRYGNVLNSTSSIIPGIMNAINDGKKLKITDNRMTRYFMTLDDCYQLINHSLINGSSGDIIIPKLPAMKIIDILEIFAKKYNVEIENIGLRPGEKLHESLINESQSLLTNSKNNYYHILPYYKGIQSQDVFEYRSDQNILTKEELNKKLNELGYLI